MVATNQALAMQPAESAGAVLERVIVQGDLAKLAPEDRVMYYRAVCESVGLNPLTRPFEYITLNGKLTLYAKKDAADQLRKIHGVSVTQVEREIAGDLCIVTAYARTADGREDTEIGVVNVKNLAGEGLANALMKATTKAKRRVTLSICGLGFLDETETETIPGAVLGEPIEQRQTRQQAMRQQAQPQAPAPALAQQAATVTSPNGATVDAGTGEIVKDAPGGDPLEGVTARSATREQWKVFGERAAWPYEQVAAALAGTDDSGAPKSLLKERPDETLLGLLAELDAIKAKRQRRQMLLDCPTDGVSADELRELALAMVEEFEGDAEIGGKASALLELAGELDAERESIAEEVGELIEQKTAA